MRVLLKQLVWFFIIGCAAAATHWCVAVSLVARVGWLPPVANVCGWLVAFWVSFFGHFHFTFHRAGASRSRAALRFFLISASGFALNEISYIWLLRVTALPYDLLLAAILIAVAGMTFLASRLWAFRHNV
ncbi:MAG: GtrA family protein [Methylobacillus sp.]|jgi:putative flippase GtrA|nr:GtrA family protein [Methylobacillus sp.]